MAELVIKISGNSKSFRKELDRIERESDKTTRELKEDSKDLSRQTDKASKKRIADAKRVSEARIRFAKRAALVIAALAVGGIAASIIEFAKFEQGLAGVSKTTDIVGKELQSLGDDISKLSIEVGTSTIELLEIAKASGQLGVKGSANILKFTKTVSALGKTTNIQGEAAAISLARISRITGESLENVDRLGSVIVQLGNNFAALEDEILFTATEIAGAGVEFGITATQALGLAAAFSELKIQPELARSSITRSFQQINKAIRGGGEELTTLISITGLTEDQLRTTFKENSVAVFQAFLDGLGRIQKGGGDTSVVLDKLNLSGIRLAATLPKLAKESGLVREALEQANVEFEDNNALNKELGIQLDTTIGRFNKLKAELALTKKEIGQEFIPIVETQIQVLKELQPFIRDVLIPTLNGLLRGISAVVVGFDDLTRAVLKFLNIPINDKFQEMRDLVKEESGIQTGLKGIISKFKELSGLSEGDVTLGVSAEDQEQTTFLGVSLNQEEAALLEQQQENIQNSIQEHLEAIAQIEDEARLVDEEKAQEQLELEEEARAAKLAADIEAIEKVEEAKKEAEKARKKAEKKAADDLIKLEKAKSAKLVELSQLETIAKIASLRQFVAEGTAAAKALFILEKANAIAETIVRTQAAMALAVATLPPPIGEAVAAQRKIQGAIQVGIIAGTAIQGFSGAVDGTVVSGGILGRDTEPFLLAKNEIVLPSKANPLSSDFDEEFGGGGALGGQQTIRLEIDITDDASQIITVNQREDSTLGVQT